MTIVSYFGRFQTYKSRIHPKIHIIVILKEEVRAYIRTMGDKRRNLCNWPKVLGFWLKCSFAGTSFILLYHIMLLLYLLMWGWSWILLEYIQDHYEEVYPVTDVYFLPLTFVWVPQLVSVRKYTPIQGVFFRPLHPCPVCPVTSHYIYTHLFILLFYVLFSISIAMMRQISTKIILNVFIVLDQDWCNYSKCTHCISLFFFLLIQL